MKMIFMTPFSTERLAPRYPPTVSLCSSKEGMGRGEISMRNEGVNADKLCKQTRESKKQDAIKQG